jgi:hypothetical protein
VTILSLERLKQSKNDQKTTLCGLDTTKEGVKIKFHKEALFVQPYPVKGADERRNINLSRSKWVDYSTFMEIYE